MRHNPLWPYSSRTPVQNEATLKEINEFASFSFPDVVEIESMVRPAEWKISFEGHSWKDSKPSFPLYSKFPHPANHSIKLNFKSKGNFQYYKFSINRWQTPAIIQTFLPLTSLTHGNFTKNFTFLKCLMATSLTFFLMKEGKAII